LSPRHGSIWQVVLQWSPEVLFPSSHPSHGFRTSRRTCSSPCARLAARRPDDHPRTPCSSVGRGCRSGPPAARGVRASHLDSCLVLTSMIRNHLEKPAGSSHRIKKGRPTSWAPELRLSLRGAPRFHGAPPGTFLLLLSGPSGPVQRLSVSYGQQSAGQDWQVSAVPVAPGSHTPSPQLGLHESPTGGWSWKFPSLMKCETRYATGEVGSAVQWISISYASGQSEQVCARQSGCRAVLTGSVTESTRHTSPNAQLLISTAPLGSRLVQDSSILHAPTGFWNLPAGSPKSLTWAL